jgi:hypothetical protein
MNQEQTLLGDRHRRHVGRSHPCGVATTAASVGLLSPIGLTERFIETTDRATSVVLALYRAPTQRSALSMQGPLVSWIGKRRSRRLRGKWPGADPVR